jgi:hypothetical protein
MNTGAILQRIRFGLDVGAGRIPGIRVASMPDVSAEARVDSVIALVLDGEATPETRAILLSGVNPLAAPPADSTAAAMSSSGAVPNGNHRAEPLSYASLVGLAIGAPEFQRR